MENKPTVLKVPIKGGKQQKIAVEDISSYREWEEEGLENKHTVIFTKAGKQFVCDVREEYIDQYFDVVDLT
jgi:hypothetical protein